MRTCLLASCLGVVLSASTASATPLSPFIDLQERGLTLTGGAVGGDLTGSSGITIDAGGSIRFGLLYWSGITACPSPCATDLPSGDQQIVFNGTSVLGTIIGTEATGDLQSVGYFADVTSLVSALGTGIHSFTLADGDVSNNLDVLDGFGLLVAYTDPDNQALTRVQVWDGLDAVNAGDESVVTFRHGAMDFDRAGDLFLLGGNGTPAPTDYVSIGGGPAIGNPFTGSAGPSFDLHRRQANVLAGVSSTAVTVGVADCGAATAPVRWQMAAFVVSDVPGSAGSGSFAGPSCGAVPEPTSLHLLGTGTLLVLLRLRGRIERRRRH